jgi:hypothetical protein
MSFFTRNPSDPPKLTRGYAGIDCIIPMKWLQKQKGPKTEKEQSCTLSNHEHESTTLITYARRALRGN